MLKIATDATNVTFKVMVPIILSMRITLFFDMFVFITFIPVPIDLTISLVLLV